MVTSPHFTLPKRRCLEPICLETGNFEWCGIRIVACLMLSVLSKNSFLWSERRHFPRNDATVKLEKQCSRTRFATGVLHVIVSLLIVPLANCGYESMVVLVTSVTFLKFV